MLSVLINLRRCCCCKCVARWYSPKAVQLCSFKCFCWALLCLSFKCCCCRFGEFLKTHIHSHSSRQAAVGRAGTITVKQHYMCCARLCYQARHTLSELKLALTAHSNKSSGTISRGPLTALFFKQLAAKEAAVLICAGMQWHGS